jgi:demethylmenaquinone methyltransferase/2-methoxy-6-polyprenyl-1,4-benzoquinol methylase
MNSDILLYYKARAQEYENVYAKPERQIDLRVAEQLLQNAFAGKRVFELACGTGYWTEIIARTAISIIATDVNDAVIEVAKSKSYYPAIVDFRIVDIFNIPKLNKQENLFGGFIWSHIKLQDLSTFIAIVNDLVENGGTVVFIDNNFFPKSNLPIIETDDCGNTYQIRKLEDGTMHKVLKNFPSEDFIRRMLIDNAGELEFINLQYYWIVKYTAR